MILGDICMFTYTFHITSQRCIDSPKQNAAYILRIIYVYQEQIALLTGLCKNQYTMPILFHEVLLIYIMPLVPKLQHGQEVEKLFTKMSLLCDHFPLMK